MSDLVLPFVIWARKEAKRTEAQRHADRFVSPGPLTSPKGKR